MKKLITATLTSVLLASAAPAFAQDLDPLTFQLKWTSQGQFAGYLVAKDLGFYEDAGLDVTINQGGPDLAPEQVIAGGGADIITTWMAAALAARERGVPIVNIAQPIAGTALEMVCSEESGVETTADFAGKTLGVWFFGNEYPFYAWMAKLGLATDGSEGGVEVLRQAYSADPLLQGQADCISVMRYNEYKQVLDAGIPEDSLKVFNFLEEGVGVLEDGLYVMEDRLEDPEFVDQITRFVEASMRGWQYSIDNPEEAAQIVINNDMSGALTLESQVYQVGVVGTMVGGPALDVEAYEQTVATLLSAVSPDNPAITVEPEGAYSTVITDALD